ncbi:MAG: dTDP-glucose 4,6-dehydratase [Brevundimonas sp.]|uniref:dTDP-glucose 4,6-dehydratase n=1 Tax=Brevundimonas sp. TaxID=1871086 RepID=UPI0025BE480A|nr:dTDP-glucose 4,6-dehydratase [Brevundimonas sp.]MBX3478340.1 dTDP-glucose 4,6-dehydratase [Brevundimonas sp.]
MTGPVLVTGAAGFIGSTLVRRMLDQGRPVVALDKLTYAGRRASLAECEGRPGFDFVQADIADEAAVHQVFARFRPSAVMNLAAESHVDRSIDGPSDFIRTNVVGVFVLLQAARTHLDGLPPADRDAFRFLHVSTDEVFGALGPRGRFDEATAYDPRSPYSASKAASDHLVRAWGHTYGLPVLVTNCSNNYGPRQHPEKLIPLTILRALSGQPLPVYGDGRQVRDWLHVSDHAEALIRVLDDGRPGRTYAVGGEAERANLDVVSGLCAALDRLAPRPDGRPHASAIEHVADRPGHDRRYAIDPTRIGRELDWRPTTAFETGLLETVRWYLENSDWWAPIVADGSATRRLGLTQAEAAASAG